MVFNRDRHNPALQPRYGRADDCSSTLICFLPSRDDEEPDLYTSDHFRMYSFKILLCPRHRPHQWTDCPYAHLGEKARRRDPLTFHYSSTACPDHRRGSCRLGDACKLSHGVFECWLHPERYRTQPCKDGGACRREVCFFVHTAEQLRVCSPRSVHDSPVSSGGVFARGGQLERAGMGVGSGVLTLPVTEVGGSDGGWPDLGWVTELVE